MPNDLGMTTDGSCQPRNSIMTVRLVPIIAKFFYPYAGGLPQAPWFHILTLLTVMPRVAPLPHV